MDEEKSFSKLTCEDQVNIAQPVAITIRPPPREAPAGRTPGSEHQRKRPFAWRSLDRSRLSD